MALKNLSDLLEYGKIGLGTVLTIGSVLYDLGESASRRVAEEAMYRSLDVVNPETLTNAYQQLNRYASDNPRGMPGWAEVFLIFTGAGMLASGIYNLAKNYKKETKE